MVCDHKLHVLETQNQVVLLCITAKEPKQLAITSLTPETTQSVLSHLRNSPHELPLAVHLTSDILGARRQNSSHCSWVHSDRRVNRSFVGTGLGICSDPRVSEGEPGVVQTEDCLSRSREATQEFCHTLSIQSVKTVEPEGRGIRFFGRRTEVLWAQPAYYCNWACICLAASAIEAQLLPLL